jgi:DNA-binding response OmpR family regulator
MDELPIILIVEDEAPIGNFVEDALTDGGFHLMLSIWRGRIDLTEKRRG